MAVRTKEEIMETIKTRMGESASDEDLAFLEDVTDTFNDYDNRVSNSGDWEKKYHELDTEWRNRYKERFFNNETPDPDPGDPDPDEHKVPTTYEDLFDYE